MNKISINAQKKYDVLIGNNILGDSGKLTIALENKKYRRIAIITDSNVEKLYLQTVCNSYSAAKYSVFSYVVPAGENSKNIQNVMSIISWLQENSFTRTDLLVALGGGVCGDLVGFIASIYLRGTDFVQIPTTFLAAIDSSVGGKTAVNIPEGKNLVGSFWQPRLVICDIDTLSTLSTEDFNSGIAEAIKYGCIWDKAFFIKFLSKDWLANELNNVIAHCINIKAEVVAQDEYDLGIRAALNWGHTIGHAIEKLSGLTVSHGYGVAVGMYVAAKAGEAIGITESGTSMQIKTALDAYKIPTETNYSAKELAEACLGDKKRSGDSLTFVMLKEIGSYFFYPLEVSKLEKFIQEGLA